MCCKQKFTKQGDKRLDKLDLIRYITYRNKEINYD